MKSHVFQMKYFLAGIYIICVIFTCFNARFYHTPLAKISSVTEKETMSRKGTRDAEEYYYTQKITARILNGTHKGEEISISNEYTSSQVQNQKYHKGDTVLLSGSRENPGKSIRSIKRDGYLALLAGGLFFLLICITGKQGFYTIISLILNTIIFAFGFQAFMKGENILNICNVIAFLFSITTLICLNGIHRKTWASVISTICVLFLIMALFEFSIQFFGDLDYSNLEYLGSMSNSADIFWTDIMLTGLGAIMAPFAAMEKRTDLYAEGDFDGIDKLEKELLAQNAQHKDWACTEELMKTTKDGKALYLHCLPADITGVSCETGEVDASVFDRYRIPLYKEASFKPYIIAAMIMLSKFENPQDILKKLEVKAAPRIMK